jgi:hypothetical protein
MKHMPAIRMKFSEFVDALLVRLYELDRDALDAGFFNLDEVARQFIDAVPRGWVFDAAKVFENRGFARCLFTYGGVSAELTGEGRLYVEEGRGTTKQIQQHPDNYFITVAGNNNQVVAGAGNTASQSATAIAQRAPTFSLIDDIDNALERDASIDALQRAEAKTYVKVIRLQIEKTQPDMTVISAVLDPLSRIPSIAGKIANLAQLLNG